MVLSQRMYARSRNGAPGGGRISGSDAKSGGLDDRFVNSALVPITLCIDSIVGSWTQDGEFILGVSAGSLAGSGAPRVVHQMIVPSTQAAAVAPDMWRMLYSLDFMATSDHEQLANAADVAFSGAQLRELSMLRYDREGCRLDTCDVSLLRAGINEEIFKSMIAAALEAIPAGRRLYISPNVKASHFMNAARAALKHLIAALPYAHRRRLNFIACTDEGSNAEDLLEWSDAAEYVRSVADNAGANVIMAPPALARAVLEEKGDRERAYVFDFEEGVFWKPKKIGGDENNADDGGAGIYADSAWDERALARDEFYMFLSRVLPGSMSFGASELDAYSVVARVLEVGAHGAGSSAGAWANSASAAANAALETGGSGGGSGGSFDGNSGGGFGGGSAGNSGGNSGGGSAGGAWAGGALSGGAAASAASAAAQTVVGAPPGSPSHRRADAAATEALKSAFSLYARHRRFTLKALARGMNGDLASNPAAALAHRDAFERVIAFEEYDRAGRPTCGGAMFDKFAVHIGQAAQTLALVAKAAESVREQTMDMRAARLCVDAACDESGVTGSERRGDAVSDSHAAFVSELLTSLLDSRRVFSMTLGAIAGSRPGFLSRFVMSRLKRAASVGAVADETALWAGDAPSLFADDMARDAFLDATERTIAGSTDPYGDGAELHSRIEYMLRNISPGDHGRAVFDCAKAMLECADVYVVDAFEREGPKLDSLRRMKLDSDGLRGDDRYMTTLALKSFFFEQGPHAANRAARDMRAMGSARWKRLSEIIREILSNCVRADQYARIIEAFTDPPPRTTPGDEPYARENAPVTRFDDMLAFIAKNKNRGECCNFLKWAFRRGMFIGAGYSEFSSAVVKFFSEFSPREFNIAQRNFAYLYVGRELSDSERNLKHILDVFRDRHNARVTRDEANAQGRRTATVALIALAVCAVVVGLFAALLALLG